jgi:hypothetical protein
VEKILTIDPFFTQESVQASNGGGRGPFTFLTKVKGEVGVASVSNIITSLRSLNYKNVISHANILFVRSILCYFLSH